MRQTLLLMLLVLTASPILAVDYAVMMDAGSSGTRVFVYEIGNSIVKYKSNLKIEPGLSAFEHNLPGIRLYLEKLLDFAKEQIGKNIPVEQVSLRLQATGGVRALSKISQERIIAEVQKVFLESGFGSPVAEVISGVAEGVYEWISINYLLGSLKNTSKPSVGLLEMGGASLQVTFKPSSTKEIYSRTYDGLGELRAWKEFGSKDCKKIPLKYALCRKSLARQLKVIHKPKLQGKFYLVDNFEQLASLLKLEKVSSEILDQQGPKICSKDLGALKQELPSPFAEQYLKRVCFQTAYMSVVLEKIGFKRNQKLISAKTIGETTLSWTLGSLVDNMLSSQKTVVMP
ncbi:MAG: hypothetical protein WCK49_00575 [Myxococcaceae bacterium]